MSLSYRFAWGSFTSPSCAFLILTHVCTVSNIVSSGGIAALNPSFFVSETAMVNEFSDFLFPESLMIF